MSKKISELTTASALSGAELVEVVQGGSNKKTTAQDIADLGSGGGTSGTYTPTLFNISNLDASTAYECAYTRIGDIVSVNGRVDIDPTAGNTLTEIDISFPVASNIAEGFQCTGVANSDTVSGWVIGNITDNRARLSLTSPAVTANRLVMFTFTYLVI